MGFAHTRRSKENYIFPVFQETHSCQFINLAFINRGLEGKIKFIQRLLNGETGHLDLFLISAPALGFRFFGKNVIQNIHDI